MTDTPDQKAAHCFLSELRTRIATQSLPYQHGVEARALESLFEVFGHARKAMKDNPGCEVFARETTRVLNVVLRPVTAKWHRASEAGKLLSRDGGDEFRADLERVQADLREFAARLAEMAYGARAEDELVPAPLSTAEMDECMAPFAYGVPPDPVDNGGIVAAEAIRAKEAEAVEQRRTALERTSAAAGQDAFGLAFSGGGIRSATFCLGVLQVLAEKRLLRDVDYLSTVSGGGYTGSFVSVQLAGGRTEADLARPHGPDPKVIQTLRRRANFLVGRSLWASWRMVLETVLGMLFNWCVPLVAIALLAMAALLWKRFVDDRGLWLDLAGFAGIVTAVAGILFFWRERAKAKSTLWGSLTLVGSLLAIAVLGAQLLDMGFEELLPELWRGRWTWAELVAAYEAGPLGRHDVWRWSTLGALLTLLPAVLRHVPVLEKPLARKVAITAALALGAFVVPALAVAASFALFALGGVCTAPQPPAQPESIGLLWLGGSTAAALLVVGALLNINVTGPHRLYRRSLARAFVDLQGPAPAGEAATRRKNGDAPWPAVPLRSLDSARAPYHLVNATVNLPSSRDERMRERRSDFFLFTKDWMGSPVVGYAPVEKWRMDGDRPDLATAMAISGAAASSSMGLGSIVPLRALLALLNIRLGYWIRHSDRKSALPVASRHPGFFCLLREMLGLQMSEQQVWLNLSDGGHIENLAVYELLRRRCKFVVCVDGEADPDFRFHGLMTLVRHAQIDFGVEIDADLTELRPDPESGHCRSHFHLCRIRYPAIDGAAVATGLFLYLKLSVTGNESELIQRYRKNNPSFPHQATLDQFFDEEQFEAYRQLGVHVAEGAFSPTLMAGRGDPADVRTWFERLARNLLTPARS